MNVYDFDKTIFYPDSSVTFVKWEMKRHPLIFLRCLPVALWHGLLYLLKIMSKEQLKENRNLEWNIRVKAALIVVFSKNDDGESVA